MYGTEQGFAAYAQERGYDVPEGNVAAALRRATTYIDGTYGARFLGVPTAGLSQLQAWPRTGVPGIDAAQVPERVTFAAYEAALVELRAPGSLSVTVTPGKRIVEVKAGSAGVRYSDKGDAVEGATPVLTVVEGLLAPFLRPLVDVPVMLRSIG